MRPPATAVTAAFYAGVAALVVAILTGTLPLVLPDALAVRLARNSEGLVLALLLAGWIQFARPASFRSRRTGAAAAVAAAACLAVGLALLLSDLPSRFRTLNETFLAAALILPYVQLRRPLPRHLAPVLSLVVLLLVVALNRTEAVVALAETLGALLLVPVALDVVDRGILDPRAVTSPRRRWSWYAFLVCAPIALSVLQYGVGLPGLAGEATRYGVRITEAFLCLLLVQLFLAVGLRRTGNRRAAGTPELVGAS